MEAKKQKAKQNEEAEINYNTQLSPKVVNLLFDFINIKISSFKTSGDYMRSTTLGQAEIQSAQRRTEPYS